MYVCNIDRDCKAAGDTSWSRAWYYASKVLEQCIFKLVFDHIATKISTSQFGFMKGRSSQQQLLLTLHEIHDNLNNSLCTDAVYLDLSKAFDSVSHSILLSKLNLMGISGRLLIWFEAYLDNRVQLVSVNGHHSTLLPVTSGVPQEVFLAHYYSLFILMTYLSVSPSPKLFYMSSILFGQFFICGPTA